LKKLTFIASVLFVLFCVTGNATAQSQNFSITNTTGMILIDVYISPNDANDWGSDVIPKDMILDGETFDFTFSGVEPSKCVWDIMFTAEDGMKYYMQDVDLCNTTTITLYKN